MTKIELWTVDMNHGLDPLSVKVKQVFKRIIYLLAHLHCLVMELTGMLLLLFQYIWSNPSFSTKSIQFLWPVSSLGFTFVLLMCFITITWGNNSLVLILFILLVRINFNKLECGANYGHEYYQSACGYLLTLVAPFKKGIRCTF